MENYTEHSKGSEWRKWDLHFHTPSSYDYEEKAKTNEDLINELANNDISVVAITDHHIIDSKRIKELQTLGRKKNVTVLPGIELRAEMAGKEPIHFIGLFPEEADLDYIWGEINAKGEIATQKLKGKKDDEIYCDLKDTCKLIKDLGGIITIHAGHKSNSIEVITNSLPVAMAQKKDIADNVHVFEIGKVSDQNDYINIVFPKIKNRYPMIICSDNHKISDYKVKENCWIKANPSFEGLKQIIYEPEGRVKIQQGRPEEKISYTIIDAVRFVGSKSKEVFDDKWIELNPNLNSIIGGKSSGKSLLLYHIAKTIDAERISSINHERGVHNLIEYPFEKEGYFDFEVKWADGETYKLKDADKPNRPITYIPQLYLNRLAEDQKDELNSLVDKMLMDSSPEYKAFRTSNKHELDTLNAEMFQTIDEYYQKKESLRGKEKHLKELGDKKAIIENQKQIKEKIEKLRKESSFTEEDERKYIELTETIKTLGQQADEANILIEVLEAVKERIVSFKEGINDTLKNAIFSDINSRFTAMSQETTDKITDIINKIAPALQKTLDEECTASFTNIGEEKGKLKKIQDDLGKATKEFSPLAEKVKNKEVFNKLQEELEGESKKIKSIEKQQVEIDKLKKALTTEFIKTKYGQLFNCYQSVISENRKYESIPDTDNLQLNSIIKIGEGKFDENFIHKINKKKALNQQFGDFFGEENNYLFDSDTHLQNANEMIDKIASGQISVNAGFDEKHVMLSLLDDYFFIDYKLLQDGDDLIKMSPGKRGIILFQLFLHLSKSKNPILIDQPEDNLDNRTVYQELNEFIKAKKIARQIIIASHNPNLVVSTDSENIIIANQAGQNKSGKNAKYKFEYVNGAIECSFVDDAKDGILFKRGVRQHVCDVLEGGEEAFAKRETKYGRKHHSIK